MFVVFKESCPECAAELTVFVEGFMYCPHCELNWYFCNDCGTWVEEDEEWDSGVGLCVACAVCQEHEEAEQSELDLDIAMITFRKDDPDLAAKLERLLGGGHE